MRQPDKISEAYTENPVGRRRGRTLQSNSASLLQEAVGDGVDVPEAYTKGSLW